MRGPVGIRSARPAPPATVDADADAAAPGEPPPQRPRWRRRGAAVASLVAVAAGGAWIAAGGGSSPNGDGDVASTTATVARRDLVESEQVDGTLGYAGSRTVTNQLDGTLTRTRSEGAVVGRGEWLYEVDGKPTAWLMYGTRPAWRGFESGMSDGEDVRQLEQNLKAMGDDPAGVMAVDTDFTGATAAAIRRFQSARGMKADGELALGEAVFLTGRARIKSRKASTGTSLRPGQEVLETSSSRRVVTVHLQASRQSLVSRGNAVEVELPDGTTVKGGISKVSKVARPGAEEGDEATVEVAIVLRSSRGTRGLDEAPVTVSIAQQARRNALSVPVTALLALEGGGSGVEVVDGDGRRRLVRVETGVFADGYVEVSGRGLRDGMKVVIPDAL